MSNTTTAYCSVQFRDPDNPDSIYMLEEGSVVACNGYPTINEGTYYYRYFPHQSGEKIMISIVRPEAGATAIHYIDLQ